MFGGVDLEKQKEEDARSTRRDIYLLSGKWVYDIPPELWDLTFSFLPQDALRRIYLVCTVFHSIINKNTELKELLPDLPMRWLPGPKYAISEDGFSITKTDTSGVYDSSALGPIVKPGGKAEWYVDVEQTTGQNIMFGVAPSNIDQNIGGNYTKCGWYIYAFDGSLFSETTCNGTPVSGAFSTKKILQGTVLGIRVDLTGQHGVMSYSYNGEEFKDAYLQLPLDRGPLHLCVMMAILGDKCRLAPPPKKSSK
eukprot:TRINITY_DN908_c0_g1_i2.p1 TRINITY_DN908_c0_g1~~TRINITY_DN908_c0_g1_i2.p1  ORF type:complete len:252 (-),score=39.74 TRINITY_DN908_c0_g1_i2:95-850(-)